MTFDCSFDGLEPTLEITSDESTGDRGKSLEKQFSKMNINSNVLQTNINADEDCDSLSSMNDFHLAETDLIQCFLRTNILQRIRWVGHSESRLGIDQLNFDL